MRYPVRHCIGVHPRSSAFIPLRRPLRAVAQEGVVPVPLTDIIEQDLLATLAGDGDPQAVLDRHAGSKGPLYVALARATAQATAGFAEVWGRVREAQAHRKDAEEHAKESEKRAREAERRASAAEKRLAAAEAGLCERQALLERADALRAGGFDDATLTKLGEVLAGAAQAEGKPTAQAVAGFLDAATDWRQLAELRAQVVAAEEKARETEAACRRKEQQAKLRSVAVDWAVWLVRRKITAEAVGTWQAIAAKLGLADEALATGLARALEEHGSLEAARKAWSAAVAEHRAEHGKLTAEVGALRRERDGLTAAIVAVREAGIAQMQEVANAAAAEIRRAAAAFERVATEAAELGQTVEFAQALRSSDPDLWSRVDADAWQGILRRLEQWSAANLANPEVPMPEDVRRQVKGSHDYPSLHGPLRMPLRGLVAWTRAAVNAADAQRAIPLSAAHSLPAGTAPR